MRVNDNRIFHFQSILKCIDKVSMYIQLIHCMKLVPMLENHFLTDGTRLFIPSVELVIPGSF